MNNTITFKQFSLLFLILIFSFSFSSAIELNSSKELNLTLEKQASDCLNESLLKISELNSTGFSTERVTDIYLQAQDVYSAQLLLNQKQDFGRVISLCTQIKTLYANALTANIELTSLLKFYEDSYEEGIDFGPVEESIAAIKSEISSERYERVSPLVEATYQQIINIKAENTQTLLFYKSTTQGIKTFFLNNWKIILFTLFALIVLTIIFFNPIKKKILQNKLNKLTIRKNNLKQLVKKTQYDYFQTGKISDSSYEVRVKNFAEMIRDIDRQIPLLTEQIARISGRKWNTQ